MVAVAPRPRNAVAAAAAASEGADYAARVAPPLSGAAGAILSAVMRTRANALRLPSDAAHASTESSRAALPQRLGRYRTA